MWCVYLLKHSETQEIYIGKTSDLKKRLVAHNAGQQTATVRKNGEWILVYTEVYRAKEDADTRERMLKHHGSSKRKLLDRIAKSLH